ncbi:MAG TPA: glycosyltransferase family 39 protein [Thermoanaerobaculia bacterium]|nr:glycosyltransferase family 39 protein [Thermoanaerobaculia bacterium]
MGSERSRYPISRRRLLTSVLLAIGLTAALSARLSHPELHTDEITYMSSVLESMVQGTVLPVQGNGELFINKPPLSLWLMRLSSEVLDPSPFAARLPSILAAVATAVVLYLFGAAVFGETVGVLAALVFVFAPGLLMLHGIRSATPDSLEILLITSAIVSLEVWRRHRRSWSLACLVACVAATAWVKSPFALIVFVVYLLATELPARRAGQGTPRFGVTVALVAGFWVGAYLLWLGTLSAATSTGAVAKRLLLQQYVRRVEGRLGKHQAQSPSYYLETTAQDFGPLLLLPAGAVTVGIAGRRKGQPLSRHDVACVVAWSLAAPLLASASVNKLPWYAYLSYPGIALLVAVSAQHLAQAVSDRKSVQSALMAASVVVLAWRMPADRVWPAEAQRRGMVGRLWEIASRDSDVVVVPAPDFQFPRQRDDGGREARLFIRTLLWRSRSSPDSDACRALLVNQNPGASEWGDELNLHPPTRKSAGLWLVDDCNGWLVEQLTAAQSPD